jgi:hypothetical protein
MRILLTIPLPEPLKPHGGLLQEQGGAIHKFLWHFKISTYQYNHFIYILLPFVSLLLIWLTQIAHFPPHSPIALPIYYYFHVLGASASPTLK